MSTTQTARSASGSATLRALLLPLHLWHLLSLDAPSIATLWTAFLAREAGLSLPASSLLAMFLAVWLLYAADRLLDARPLLRHALPTGLEARHLFHHRHRSRFLLVLAPVTLLLGLLLPRLAPAALRLDLLLGTLLVGYFVLIHATGSAARLPKEVAVGLFFAVACFIPTIARRPGLHLVLLPAAILFAALCSLNCVTIFALENPATAHLPGLDTHPLTRFAVHHLRSFALLLLGAAITLFFTGAAPARVASAAMALSTGALLWLRRASHTAPQRPLSNAVTQRALADLALATPLLLWPWLPR